MKTGITLPELRAEIARQAALKADFVTDTRRISPSSNGSTILSVDGAGDEGGLGEFTVNDHAHGQIAQRLGIPKAYYDRMRTDAPELLDRNIAHWFVDKPERRMLRTLDGTLRAFLSDRYRPRDNISIATYLLPHLEEIIGDGGGSIESCQITDLRLYIKATLPSVQAEVKVGDIVSSGVVISNSEVGAGAFNVETLLYRLWCLNGAVTGFKLSKYHVGRRIGDGGEDDTFRIFSDETLRADDEAFFLAARDAVKAACSEVEFEKIVRQCRDLAELRIDADPVLATERLANDAGLTEAELAFVRQHLIAEGDLSAWGYVNAVTRASQDVDDYERATELERLGGSLIEADASRWSALLAA